MQEQIGFPYNQRQGRTPKPPVTHTAANPHRAGHYSGLHPEDQPYSSQEFDEEYDDRFPIRRGSSAMRWTSTETQVPVKHRRVIVHNDPPPEGYTTRTSRKQEPVEPAPQNQKRKVHWLVFLGVGLLIMVLGWIILGSVNSWWQMQQDNWHYGTPRTYQTDQVVGHHDSSTNPSHFIALNLNGKVEVIEVQGGDPAHSIIYPGPTLLGQDANLAPVTLTFTDTTGNGRLDMEVHVLGETIIYLNNGTKFDAPKNS
ncbi:MAG TPA: hypothetical protein VNG51_24370 [Ktedonobacteraceae bacterium]|nr:hypothetical protein [Ktedonobacteraceae bacterium]